MGRHGQRVDLMWSGEHIPYFSHFVSFVLILLGRRPCTLSHFLCPSVHSMHVGTPPANIQAETKVRKRFNSAAVSITEAMYFNMLTV